MIIWFLTGCTVGGLIMGIVSGNAYEKGYQDGRNFERWLRR